MGQKAPTSSNAVCGIAVFTCLNSQGFVVESHCFVAAAIVARVPQAETKQRLHLRSCLYSCSQD